MVLMSSIAVFVCLKVTVCLQNDCCRRNVFRKSGIKIWLTLFGVKVALNRGMGCCYS